MKRGMRTKRSGWQNALVEFAKKHEENELNVKAVGAAVTVQDFASHSGWTNRSLGIRLCVKRNVTAALEKNESLFNVS